VGEGGRCIKLKNFTIDSQQTKLREKGKEKWGGTEDKCAWVDTVSLCPTKKRKKKKLKGKKK